VNRVQKVSILYLPDKDTAWRLDTEQRYSICLCAKNLSCFFMVEVVTGGTAELTALTVIVVKSVKIQPDI